MHADTDDAIRGHTEYGHRDTSGCQDMEDASVCQDRHMHFCTTHGNDILLEVDGPARVWCICTRGVHQCHKHHSPSHGEHEACFRDGCQFPSMIIRESCWSVCSLVCKFNLND